MTSITEFQGKLCTVNVQLVSFTELINLLRLIFIILLVEPEIAYFNIYVTSSWVRFEKALSTIKKRVKGPAPARAWCINEPVNKSMAVVSCPFNPSGPCKFSSLTLCHHIKKYKNTKTNEQQLYSNIFLLKESSENSILTWFTEKSSNII